MGTPRTATRGPWYARTAPAKAKTKAKTSRKRQPCKPPRPRQYPCGPASAAVVTARLAARMMPQGDGDLPRSWLDVVEDAARAAGAVRADVCTPGRRALRAAHARHLAWAELHAAGYSYPDIGAPWGADHSTVMAAVNKLAAKETA